MNLNDVNGLSKDRGQYWTSGALGSFPDKLL
jgi:hypothetical protein